MDEKKDGGAGATEAGRVDSWLVVLDASKVESGSEAEARYRAMVASRPMGRLSAGPGTESSLAVLSVHPTQVAAVEEVVRLGAGPELTVYEGRVVRRSDQLHHARVAADRAERPAPEARSHGNGAGRRARASSVGAPSAGDASDLRREALARGKAGAVLAGWTIVLTRPDYPVPGIGWMLSGKRRSGAAPNARNLAFLRRIAVEAGAPDVEPEQPIAEESHGGGTWVWRWEPTEADRAEAAATRSRKN